MTSFRAFPYMSVKVSSHYVIARDRKQGVCDQRGDHLAREMGAKAAFLLASCQLRVSEDWVVGAPGLEPGTR